MSKLTGKRKGAGRPPVPEHLKRRSKHFKLPPDLCDWLEQQDNATAKIEYALRATYDLNGAAQKRPAE